MKLFVIDQTVYFLQDETLYKTQMDCYGFCDLDEGEMVVENPVENAQIFRIRQLLMPVRQVAQDFNQLALF